MKTLVLTLCSGANHEMIGAITQPQMKAYAKRIGAKFAVTRVREDYPHSVPWTKLEAIHHWLGEFDRVLFIDNDCLINADDCPNLFDVVPETHFGAYVEGTLEWRLGAMVEEIKRHGLKYDKDKREPDDNDYFNSGVLCVSKCHRDLFTWPDIVHDSYYEQSLLCARVFCYDVPLCRLNYKFNRMSLQDQHTGEERHASHIVHWAGSNDFPKMTEMMKATLELWKNKVPAISRFYIEANGGIGDVIEAEPVLRYAIEKMYDNDPSIQWRIVTAFERVLSHFRRYPNVKVAYRKMDMDVDVPFCHWQTHPGNNNYTRMFFPYHAVHNHDFAAYSLLKDQLNNADKQIELEVKEDDWVELKKAGFSADAFQGRPARPPVAVHAGAGWTSKTFPQDWWQRIVNKLARDYTIVLFGNEKCVPVELPYQGIDVRAKLSLGGTFALIKACPILLTNDSSPVHMGGAFGGWICMIGSCKRPELVFPFRKGSVDYRTISITHKLTCRPKTLRPNYPHPLVISDINGESQKIEDYLPQPDEVVEAVRSCRV